MKKVFGLIGIIVGTQFIVSLPAIADTTYVSGVISTNTIWDPTGSPYIVTGNVLVDSLVTLDIKPGVEVRFAQDKYIMIKGNLYAIGTEADSIIISARDTTQMWYSLRFEPASAGSLKYCRIEYAGESAVADDSSNSLYIGYNTISNNRDIDDGHVGGGIATIYGLATIITNNTISNNFADANGGGIYAYGSPIISNNTISNNRANTKGGGIWTGGSPTIDNNTISNNRGGYGGYGGGGIYVYYDPDSITTTITHNTISNNTGGIISGGGGIWSEAPVVISHNIICNNDATEEWISSDFGGGILNSGSAMISNNTIFNNRGIGILNSGIATMTRNTIFDNYEYDGDANDIYSSNSSSQITHNTITGVIRVGAIKINHCNLYSNATDPVIYNNTAFDIDATNNWWNTTNTDSIDTWGIYDYYDDFELGKVNYIPILISCDTIAPVPSPLNLAADVLKAEGTTLSWDSVPALDLAGYKVWYDTDGSGYPYNGTGANEGSSPIDVGNVTTFELTGLTASTYYLAVTAYDNSGDSSWYSNEVTVTFVGVEESSNSQLTISNPQLSIYPNPSMRNVMVKYGLPEKASISLKLYDISGRLVKTIYSGTQEKGYYEVEMKQDGLIGGIYFIRFETGKFKATRKLTIIR